MKSFKSHYRSLYILSPFSYKLITKWTAIRIEFPRQHPICKQWYCGRKNKFPTRLSRDICNTYN